MERCPSCEEFETFDPTIEYAKFLKRKPIVNTAKLYEDLHQRSEVKCPYNFKGYGVEKDESPMYRTTNSEYGFFPPNGYTIPTRNFPLTQRFTNDLARTGMYRNYSLNTPLDPEFH